MIYIAAAKTEYFLIKQSKISILIALKHIAGLFVRNFNSILIIDHKMICNSLETYYVAHDIEIKGNISLTSKIWFGELNIGLILIYSHNEMNKNIWYCFHFSHIFLICTSEQIYTDKSRNDENNKLFLANKYRLKVPKRNAPLCILRKSIKSRKIVQGHIETRKEIPTKFQQNEIGTKKAWQLMNQEIVSQENASGQAKNKGFL